MDDRMSIVHTTLVKLLAAFSLAYLLSGFVHATVMVAFAVCRSGNLDQVIADAGIFLRFIGWETVVAPISGGFIPDAAGKDDVTYINLYPLIAPVFIIFYFFFSRGWRWFIPVFRTAN